MHLVITSRHCRGNVSAVGYAAAAAALAAVVDLYITGADPGFGKEGVVRECVDGSPPLRSMGNAIHILQAIYYN